MPPKLLALSIDVDPDETVSMSWCVDSDGAIRHQPTGLKVSTSDGVELGHRADGGADGAVANKISPADIEIEEEMLGHGAAGQVQKGVHRPTGMLVAIKTMKIEAKQKKELMLNEIKGLVNAQGCPQLVQWYAAFVSKNTSAIHIALEYMDCGSLADIKKKIPTKAVIQPSVIAAVARDICLGLSHLHGKKKVLHRDIKPENILVNKKGEIKLTDFGISRDLNSTVAMAATFVGTATYMSPERASGQDYGYASDIWSVGMVLYELATKKYPFPGMTSFPTLFEHLCLKPEPRLDPNVYPPALCEFIEKTLVRDPDLRFTADQLLELDFCNNEVATHEEIAAFLQTNGIIPVSTESSGATTSTAASSGTTSTVASSDASGET